MKKEEAVVKVFGSGSVRIKERVARYPKLQVSSGINNPLSNIFCLRIDADEYSQESFSRYYKLFEKHKDAITIFFSVDSFKKAAYEIKRCKEIDLDIQSHGFYHYTYADYESNRYNINKAKIFLENLGIHTRGFASPMGRWNRPLMKALEDEQYEYSSDFAYDYLGLPSYPYLNGRYCKVLEIPIFPVAPELFFKQKKYKPKDILSYYKNAIDEMLNCNIPIIIYAHTSIEHKKAPELLEEIAEYALLERKLEPKKMTEISNCWKENFNLENKPVLKLKIPGADYSGQEINLSLCEKIKDLIKDGIDFERVTPADELRCIWAKRAIKMLARKIL